MKLTMGWRILCIGALLTATGAAFADADYLEHGRISFDTGGLLVKGAQDSEWAAAAVNALIVPGDTLWIDKEGTAEMEMAGANFLRFADQSKAEIVTLPPNMFIRGWVGSFYVHRFARSEGNFIFATPAATIDIACDSMVRLDIAENGSLTVSVRWGSAAVHTDLGGDVTAGDATRVWVDPGYLPSEPVPFDRNVSDAFDNWNSERARLLAQSAQTTPKEVVVTESTVGIYDLPRYGEWVYIDHRPYWRPTVVVNYEPYRYGYWNYMPAYGHVWVDEYPFAYVTSHYGRWRYAATYGWVWSYDPVWGPAWVASVRAGNYFLWAPVDYYYRPVLVPGASTFMMAGLTFSWYGSCYARSDYLYWGPGYIYQPGPDWVGRIGSMPPRDISIWNIGFSSGYTPSIPFSPEFRSRAFDFKPSRSIRGLPTSALSGPTPGDRAIRLESHLDRHAFTTSGPSRPNPVRTAALGARSSSGLRQVNLRQTEQAYLPLQQSETGGSTGRGPGFVPESQRLTGVRELSGTHESIRSNATTLRSGQNAGRSSEGAPVNRINTPSTTVPRTDLAVRDLESSAPAPRGSGQITRTPVRQPSSTRSLSGNTGISTGSRSPATSGIRTAPTTAPVQRRETTGTSLRSMPSPSVSNQSGSLPTSVRSAPGNVSRTPNTSLPSSRSLSSGPSGTSSSHSSGSGSSRAPSISVPSSRSLSSSSSSMPSLRSSGGGSSRAPSISIPHSSSSSSSTRSMPSLRSSGSGSSRMPSISAPRSSSSSNSTRSMPSLRSSGNGSSSRRGR